MVSARTFLVAACVGMAAVTMAAASQKLFADLYEIQNKLTVADDRLVQLSHRKCQSGSGNVTLCPTYNAKFYDALYCIMSPLKGAAPSQTIDIVFGYPLYTIPETWVVSSGFSYIVGAGFTILVDEVTTHGMTVTVSGDIPLSATYVQFEYIACDTKIEFPYTYLDKEY